MDYLKERFNDSLQEEGSTYVHEGVIHIREKNWSPSEFLEVAGEELYEEVFNEWFDERKTVMLQLAEEILDLYDNRDRYENLKESYKKGAVMPFVGAGMSVSSGYPGWTGYLRSVCRETKVDIHVLDEMMVKGQYEEAAQILFYDMGDASFTEHLNNSFGRHREIYGPVNYLPKLFKSCVITTNYDPILEDIYEREHKQFEEVLLGSSAVEFPQLMATGKPFLLKLHGQHNKQRDRVLTLSEYQAAYSDKKTIKNLISHVFFAKTLVFIGCSLVSDRTLSHMSEYVREFGHNHLPRHYAFLKIREGEDRRERKKQLVAANIFPIWYENDDHDEAMEALLLTLVDGEV